MGRKNNASQQNTCTQARERSQSGRGPHRNWDHWFDPEEVGEEALDAVTARNQTMKSSVFYKRPQPQRAEAVAFASLGLAALLGVVCATSAMFDFIAGREAIVAALSAPSSTVAENSLTQKRARVELWRLKADARTLVAALCYVLDPRA